MYPGIHAKVTPDKPAVIMTGSGETVSYAQLEDRSLRLANWFRDRGLRRGDVVAMISDNSPRIFEVYWATQRAGLYLVPINYRLSPQEIDYLLENSGASALFVGKGGVAAAGNLGCHPAIRCHVSLVGALPGFDIYDEILERARGDVPRSQPRGADMLYSSGTTGRPKGVKPELPDRDVSEPGDTMLELFSSYFGFDADTVYLSPAPLYHAAPLRTCATAQMVGGTAIVMERFDAEAALAAIENYRVTHSQWVPTMFVRMLKLADEARARNDLSSLKVAIHSAAPCPIEVKRAMIEWWGPKLFEFYSSTEMNGMTLISADEWSVRPGSVGKAVLGRIHICDDAGNELLPGEIGTIFFERDKLPFVYHGEPEKTLAAQHPSHSGWTTVGDVGRVDEDGYLFLADRKDFMIISGGVNIYPQEIEDALILHPSIADVAVIGIPDSEMGEQVKAVAQLVPGLEGSDVLAEELRAFVRERLAGFKVPRSVDFTNSLPRSPVGKLLKGQLRQTYLALRTDSQLQLEPQS